jgi:ABC-2 type transport system permease protein
VVVPQSFRLFGEVERSQLDAAAGVLRWSPPGLAARAVVEARAGEVVDALAALAGAATMAAALAWWWMAALERSLTTTSTAGPSSRRRAPELFARAWSWLPRDRRGAVAAKELRYYFRDPRQRAGTLVWLLFAAALPIGIAVGNVQRPEIVLAAIAFALLTGLAGINQFAFDGGALWMNVVSGTDVRPDLVGKNLALGALAMALVAGEAVVLAALVGGWAWIPVAVAIAAATLGVVLGIGNVFSVRAPQPAPASTSNLFATNTGQGCSSGLLQLLAVLIETVLLVPVAISVALPLVWWRPALALTTPLALAYGWLCWRTGLARAVAWLSPRQPEFLDALSPRRAG